MEGVAKNPMLRFADGGWVFSYSRITKFVEGSHPMGARISVCEVFCPTTKERDEVGNALAELFNQRSVVLSSPH